MFLGLADGQITQVMHESWRAIRLVDINGNVVHT